ncbi:uncharacterized protein BHQ10_003673 [Talaromyces amestolkiae]|uniref:CHAT domain-containing protein n=1 Tax=Talaromyces amestolkiae TaxID=1196081 RepID=A0A364KVZ5_TALAM|nr:uncharacterized protein BHQ10_003673 [Talaromyces amestolkiae]RAO67661.1 hypothetical protein BHQ10_003673 [Talaromyces amestolkiae]
MPYIGSLASLYGSLPDSSVIPILENAILLTRMGLYARAEGIFEQKLRDYHNLSVVAIHYAEIFLPQFRFRNACEILESAIQAHRDYEAPETRLMRIFAATCKIKTKAVWKPAIDEINTLGDWLRPVALEDYTDIQVECIRKYALACSFVSVNTNKVTPEMKSLPTLSTVSSTSTSENTVPWEGLTELRTCLTMQNRINEAIKLSTVERIPLSLQGRYQLATDLINLISAKLVAVEGQDDGILWRVLLLELKLEMVTLCMSVENDALAESWSQTLISEWETLSSLLQEHGQQKYLWAETAWSYTIEFYRLKLKTITAGGSQELFSQALKLAKRMAISIHVSTPSCFDLAMSIADKVYASQPFVLKIQKSHIYHRSQQFLEASNRIDDAANNLSDFLYSSVRNLNTMTQSFRLLESFLERYPTLHEDYEDGLPRIRYSLLRFKYQVYDKIKRPDSQDDLNEVMEKLETLKLGFSSQPGDFQREPQVRPSDMDFIDQSLINEERNANDVLALQDWFMWSERESAGRVIKDIVSRGDFDSQQLSLLFGTQEVENKSDEELLTDLVGSIEKPVPGSEWRRRSPVLRRYLLEDCGHNVTFICLWIALHNQRYEAWNAHFQAYIQAHVRSFKEASNRSLSELDEEEKSFQDIWEFKNALEDRLGLQEAQDTLAYEHYSRQTQILRSMLPQILLVMFLSSTRCRELNERIGFLDLAEDVSRTQEAHWRAMEDVSLWATEIHMMTTISGIRIELGNLHGQDLFQVVDRSVSMLEETESIFGIAISNIGTGHALFTHELKSTIGQKSLVWNIGSTAIRILHCAITAINLNAKNRTEGMAGFEKEQREHYVRRLWHWVQRTKARTLAQHMRLDSVPPESMLHDMQNELLHGNHREQVKLTNAIQDTKPEARSDMVEKLEHLRCDSEALAGFQHLGYIREYLKTIESPLGGSGSTAHEAFAELNLDDPVRKQKPWVAIQAKLQRMLHEIDNSEDRLTPEEDGKADLKTLLKSMRARSISKKGILRILEICMAINNEERLLQDLDVASDSSIFDLNFQLRHLKEEMRQDTLLKKYLDIREGNPLSEDDLQTLCGSRNSKVVFIDWFRVTHLLERDMRVHMLTVRNGVYRLVDLQIDSRIVGDAVQGFLTGMKPNTNQGRRENLDLCQSLILPLFQQKIVEQGDTLVICQTEGLYHFPFHAVNYHDNTDKSYDGTPIIAHHPVVYCPSLSVLHNSFRTRINASNTASRIALSIGGVEDQEHHHGSGSVTEIGTKSLQCPDTVFAGPEATLVNFRLHVGQAEIVHVHLHSTFKRRLNNEFTIKPLNQALKFNDRNEDGSAALLTAREIFDINTMRGAHISLVACASGRFDAGTNREGYAVTTDEVTGLVPAWMVAGAGSVVSATWAIKDEYAAEFGKRFFSGLRKLAEEQHQQRLGTTGNGSTGDEDAHIDTSGALDNWIDLAGLQQSVVMALREKYGAEGLYSWAGFVLSGYWKMRPWPVTRT